jgi:ribosomal protein S18 acetylase RimI-like enzyme
MPADGENRPEACHAVGKCIMLIEGDSFSLCLVDGQDVPAILEVYRQCEDFLALGPKPQATMQMVLDDLEHSQQWGGQFFAIIRGNEMVGVVDFVPDYFEGVPGTAYLSLLMIAREHRNCGLGRKVVEVVEAEIQKNAGITAIRSGVQVNNPDAIGFWLRMGYAITGGPDLQPDRTTVFHLYKEIMHAGHNI